MYWILFKILQIINQSIHNQMFFHIFMVFRRENEMKKSGAQFFQVYCDNENNCAISIAPPIRVCFDCMLRFYIHDNLFWVFDAKLMFSSDAITCQRHLAVKNIHHFLIDGRLMAHIWCRYNCTKWTCLSKTLMQHAKNRCYDIFQIELTLIDG